MKRKEKLDLGEFEALRAHFHPRCSWGRHVWVVASQTRTRTQDHEVTLRTYLRLIHPTPAAATDRSTESPCAIQVKNKRLGRSVVTKAKATG